MSVICASSCPETGSVRENYYDNCAPVTLEYGATYFGLIKCDYEFTDILDPAEWTTALAAGDVVVSPPGIIEIPVPTQNTFRYTGCGLEKTGTKTYALNYLTYFQDVDLNDYEFFDEIELNALSYRLFWWDCQDRFHIERNWVAAIKAWTTGDLTIAGYNPGFEYSVIQTPILIAGEEDLGQWSINLQVKTANMIKAAYLPGVSAVLV